MAAANEAKGGAGVNIDTPSGCDGGGAAGISDIKGVFVLFRHSTGADDAVL